MTKASRNGRNWWTTDCPLVYRLSKACDAWVIYFCKVISVMYYIEERLKQIDVI
jgi:hypothetical protein